MQVLRPEAGDPMTAIRHTLPAMPVNALIDYTPIEPRPLHHCKHSTRPSAGLDFTEWCIEKQLELAYDCDEPDMLDVLAASRPHDEGRIREHIDTLYTLNAEIVDAERSGPSLRWRAAVDDYNDELYTFARLIGGRS